jgi:hypothetical protein
MAEKKAETAKPKTVKIKLPLTKHEKEDKYVAVNGRTYQIKRGETVEVPESVAEVLENQEKMLAEAYAFEEEASAKATANELN